MTRIQNDGNDLSILVFYISKTLFEENGEPDAQIPELSVLL